MSSDVLKPLEEYPDVNFIDGYTLEQLETDMIQWYQDRYAELTGKEIVLSKASTERIKLQTAAYYIFFGFKKVDFAGKMNTLKHAFGDYLINLGAMKQVYPREATGATATIRFWASAVRTSATGIPAGSRVTAGDGVYFATNEYAEIPAGDQFVDVRATCMTPGTGGNVYGVGDLKYMVDLVPMIKSAENITASENGTDAETEEDLKEEIYLAPDGYTSGGSGAAYEKIARDYNQTIADIKSRTPQPCVVELLCLLQDGELPGEEFLSGLKEYMMQPGRKMLTDTVIVKAPERSEFEISLTYWISRSDKARADSIGEEVKKAVDDYVLWQKSKIGRDINPDELQQRIKAAGVKRMRITKPVFTVVEDIAVADLKEDGINIVYGGLEDD